MGSLSLVSITLALLTTSRLVPTDIRPVSLWNAIHTSRHDCMVELLVKDWDWPGCRIDESSRMILTTVVLTRRQIIRFVPAVHLPTYKYIPIPMKKKEEKVLETCLEEHCKSLFIIGNDRKLKRLYTLSFEPDPAGPKIGKNENSSSERSSRQETPLLSTPSPISWNMIGLTSTASQPIPMLKSERRPVVHSSLHLPEYTINFVTTSTS